MIPLRAEPFFSAALQHLLISSFGSTCARFFKPEVRDELDSVGKFGFSFWNFFTRADTERNVLAPLCNVPPNTCNSSIEADDFQDRSVKRELEDPPEPLADKAGRWFASADPERSLIK